MNLPRFWFGDADTFTKWYRDASLCWVSTYLKLRFDGSGDIQTWLRRQRADLSFDTFGSPPPVGAECNCTANLQTSTLPSHALASLHWLRISERFVYKIAKLKFKVLHRSHWCTSNMLFVSPICLVDRLFAPLALTTWWCNRSNCQQSAIVLSRLPVVMFGIVCQQTLRRHRQWLKTHLFRRSFRHLMQLRCT